MKLSYAVLAGFAMVALAFYAGTVQTAHSQQAKGPFMLSAATQNTAWVINQATGQTAYCLRDNTSLDKSFIKSRPPFCSGWSE